MKSINILLYGYIDTNVIDGSAFFLPAMANMISSIPNVHVDLLLSRPIKRLTVLKEVLGNANVRVIDPFAESYEGRTSLQFLDGDYISHAEAARLIEFQETLVEYDVKIIRSTEVATSLSYISTDSIENLMLYVTGIVDPNQPPNVTVLDSIRRLADLGSKFILQTDEMVEYLTEVLLNGEIAPESVLALYPMVPDVSDDFEKVFRKKDAYSNFVYTGKFVRDWNPAEIISGFNEVWSDNRGMRLDVAGDQFRADEANPTFIDEIGYLLKERGSVIWHGGVDRDTARHLIAGSDIGIGWRHENLDTSLELSTKLLEYGSLGKPCIINRTPMHESIFGIDYPLFANSMREYTELLELIVIRPDLVETAAKTAFKVSLGFTYSEAARRLLPFLLDISSVQEAIRISSGIESVQAISMLDHSPEEFVSLCRVEGLTRIVRVVGPFIVLDKGDPSDNSIELAPVGTGVLDLYVEWRASVMTFDASMRNSTVDMMIEDSKTIHESFSPKEDHPDLEKLRQELKSAKKALLEASYHSNTINEKLRISERQLSALRQSKLGKIQVSIWSRRLKE